MVRNAEDAAFVAESDYANEPGMCLKQTRIWCDIPALYPDAATAWNHATGKHAGDSSGVPRGAPVYWGGGSSGYGHIALSLGNGLIRSTDAGGAGKIATVDIGWVSAHWGLPYAGWATSINGVTIPGLEQDEDMPLNEQDLDKIDKRIRDALADFKPSYVDSFLAGEVAEDPETNVKKALRLSADHAREGDTSSYAVSAAAYTTREVVAFIVLVVLVVAAFGIAVLAAVEG